MAIVFCLVGFFFQFYLLQTKISAFMFYILEVFLAFWNLLFFKKSAVFLLHGYSNLTWLRMRVFFFKGCLLFLALFLYLLCFLLISFSCSFYCLSFVHGPSSELSTSSFMAPGSPLKHLKEWTTKYQAYWGRPYWWVGLPIGWIGRNLSILLAYTNVSNNNYFFLGLILAA